MESIIKEMANASQKLMKSYETLQNINDVEIAITPKTEVYKEDKLTLYRYNRDTDATYKTPVLIVYA